MKQEHKAGRRIVSKGAYAANVGKKTVLSIVGVGFLLVGLLKVLQTILNLDAFLHGSNSSSDPQDWVSRRWLCELAGIALLWLYIGIRSLKKVKKVDVGVPLTRANAADLPALDSLVRASQEPAHAQEGVLLRAASGKTQAGQEGQLLRASVGKQE